MKKLLYGTGIVLLLLAGWLRGPALAQQVINGYRIFVNVAAPATPASGSTAVYVDSSSKKLSSKDDAGLVTTLITPVNPYKRQCEMAWGGTGTSNVLQSGDDAVANNGCLNNTGFTWTITAVACQVDTTSTSLTIAPTFGSDGTGTTMLSGAMQCGTGTAYAYETNTAASVTISNAAITSGSGIRPVQGGTLTGIHSVHVVFTYTIPSP